MERKSIAQEYFILAADQNGTMPPMRRDESYAGLVAAGFMDLLFHQVVSVEKKRITVIKKIPLELAHLTSLHQYLNEKPRTVGKLMADYCMGSRLRQLMTEVGESLLADGVAAAGTGGLFGPKKTYIPQEDYKARLVGIIKSALEGEDEISLHDSTLVCILQKTKNLNQSFSRQERREIKARLKEIKKDPQNKQLAEMINYVTNWITVMIASMVTSG